MSPQKNGANNHFLKKTKISKKFFKKSKKEKIVVVSGCRFSSECLDVLNLAFLSRLGVFLCRCVYFIHPASILPVSGLKGGKSGNLICFSLVCCVFLLACQVVVICFLCVITRVYVRMYMRVIHIQLQ